MTYDCPSTSSLTKLFSLMVSLSLFITVAQASDEKSTDDPLHIRDLSTVSTIPANARIFCTGYGPPLEQDDAGGINPTMVRWGGNTASRFNFKTGNIWNAGSDWHYANVSRGSKSLWIDWIREHRNAGRQVIFTVPILGWLAKDAVTRGDAKAPDPTRTSVAMTDADFRLLVTNLRDLLPLQERIYPLDNEPFQWHAIHGDAVSKKISPQEFAARWLHYAKLIREVDKQALLTGPGIWGWADLPNLEPFLDEVLGTLDTAGKPLLNIVSAGIYPQNSRLLEDLADITGHKISQLPNQEELATLRFATTANLDDKSYVDPSWIGQPVNYVHELERRIQAASKKKKLPKSQQPGIGISEYNWGGAWTDGGAAAQAILLIKGLKLPLHHMCSFTWPPPDSRAGILFQALRDFVIGKNSANPAYSVFKGQDSRDPWIWLQAQNKQRALLFIAPRNARVVLPQIISAKEKNFVVQSYEIEKKQWLTVPHEKRLEFNVRQYQLYRIME